MHYITATYADLTSEMREFYMSFGDHCISCPELNHKDILLFPDRQIIIFRLFTDRGISLAILKYFSGFFSTGRPDRIDLNRGG